MSRPEYVLKIGGSLLTDKSSRETVSPQFRDLISRVKQNPDGVIIHGAGSFGHPHADENGLKEGSRQGVLETHNAVKKLNSLVVRELRDNNVKAFPLHPSSFSFRDPETRLMTEQIKTVCEEGFTPVIHGDGIVTKEKGFTVISGDEILALLEEEFQTGHAGFCTSEKGVLNSKGETLASINSLHQFEELKIQGEDVTGGMKNKIQEILEKDIEASVFGAENLSDFMKGHRPGTIIRNR